MMKLQKLEISGFKSFVDPVTLEFAPGVTGIVGPNGCGKSNLSDAISWVLGEQSAKSLRSGTMDDVIFSGSERRKPLGMAEVTLTLETDSSVPGAVEGKIVISRRVYRGGEGQYRLNGRRVRLKEIRDLLMGTGLGIRAYSIIEQGKIGLILSGKPQERRKLLEEAAGVTRYKMRRRIAELKLEEATANLLRLEDIVSEVERALRSLKRQASAALRFAAKKEEYTDLLDRVLLGRWHRLSSRRAERRRILEETTDVDAKLVAEVHRLEDTLAAKRQELDALAQKVADLHQEDAELAARIQGRQGLLQGAKENLEQIAERKASGQTTAQERKRLADQNQAALVTLAQQKQSLETEYQDAQREVDGDRSALTERAADLGASERHVRELRERILESVGRLNAARGELHQQNVESEKAALRRSHLEEESTQHAQEVSEAAESLSVAQRKVTDLEKALTASREERTRLEGRLQEQLSRETTLNQRVQEDREGLATVTRRLDVLQQLDAAHVRGREGLLSRLAEVGILEPRFLGDVARAPKGWGRCIDFFLDQLSEAVLVPEGTDPLEIAEALRETRTPAILIGELGELGEDQAVATIEDSAIVASLSEALELPPGLARALPPAYLVETAEQAERLARLHPTAAFASRQALWARGGLLHLEGERKTPGTLERRQEMEALEKRLPELQDAVEKAEAELSDAIAKRTQRAEEIHRQDGAMAETQRELAVAQARCEDLAGRVRRLEKEASNLEKERHSLVEEASRLVEHGSLAAQRAVD
ncbi:MAG: AAA family ATPase, partial [Thermoanaerobaculia bacterium]|nr:AAA family ATPase [Thermoanaerobaculia bacterium]